MAPAPEAETEGEAAERQAEYDLRRVVYEEERQRREDERKQQFEREQAEHETERNRRAEMLKVRESTFNRILESAPPTFSAAQLRVFLRILVNLDPYTFTDDVAEYFATDTENSQQTAEEILLSALNGLPDEKLTGFALRLALTEHTNVPREGEFDFLTEAEAVFTISQPTQVKVTAQKKQPSMKPSTKKAATKKKVAA
jgi:ParB family chromosome partitioning protein